MTNNNNNNKNNINSTSTTKSTINKHRTSAGTSTSNINNIFWSFLSFLFGCSLSATFLLNYRWYGIHTATPRSNIANTNTTNNYIDNNFLQSTDIQCSTNNTTTGNKIIQNNINNNNNRYRITQNNDNIYNFTESIETVLNSIRILVVIVAFDFSQLPHLEEVLSSYHDVCTTTGIDVMDIHIHTTIPYPVWLIDLFNSRIVCTKMTIQIIIKPKILRLHLVDCHRTTFYNNIDNYDLFIYTEDDIRVTATTIATYLYETKYVEAVVTAYNNDQKHNAKTKLRSSDYNIGIVRYEYNFPSNVIIDDNTRHATQNVTRVYWEHSGDYIRPDGIIPNAVRTLQDAYAVNDDIFNGRYITMKNHHQGMFLATRHLLKEWQHRKGGSKCDFATIRNRPGSIHQPSQGTQRVWMSSNMLYGKKHCNVQQLLVTNNFGTLTVFHIPNKNYRRVGKYRKRIFKNGTEIFQLPSITLLSSIQLHIALRKYSYSLLLLQQQSNEVVPTYKGAVTMIDDTTSSSYQQSSSSFIERRMTEYNDYVNRGGIMNENDMIQLDLVEYEV